MIIPSREVVGHLAEHVDWHENHVGEYFLEPYITFSLQECEQNELNRFLGIYSKCNTSHPISVQFSLNKHQIVAYVSTISPKKYVSFSNNNNLHEGRVCSYQENKCRPRDTTKDVHDSVFLYVEVWLVKHVSVPSLQVPEPHLPWSVFVDAVRPSSTAWIICWS